MTRAPNYRGGVNYLFLLKHEQKTMQILVLTVRRMALQHDLYCVGV